MIFFIAGASGSGKTSCIDDLENILPNSMIYDFDMIGVPDSPDKIWRQKSTEQWLKKYLTEKKKCKNFILCGQIVLGEILACPSADKIGKINFCLLDVSDVERIRRLKERNTFGVNQDMLNWAAWLRMHHNDPSWHQSVIKDNCWHKLDFSRWDRLTSWKDFATTTIIDTTHLNISQTAKTIKAWISSI